MSAFIISNECMNRIVNAIYENGYSFMGIHPRDTNSLSKIGRKLFEMNVESVNYRYSKRNSVPEFRLWPQSSTLVQSYKDIQCLLYQSFEGNVPNSNAYKELDMIGKKIAEKIVSKLPEFDQASWG